MKNSSLFPGLLLIAFGVLLLANNMGIFVFSMAYLWPLFLLVPGIVFELSFFATGKNSGVLVPGGILILYGFFFYFNIITGWNFMDSLWPFFLLGPAFGLFQLYVFGGREKGVLIASSVLGILSMIFFSFTLFGFASEFIAPSAMIIIGLVVLMKGKREPKSKYIKENNKSDDKDLEQYYDTENDDE